MMEKKILGDLRFLFLPEIVHRLNEDFGKYWHAKPTFQIQIWIWGKT